MTSLQRRKMGTLGDPTIELSVLGLGCNNFGTRLPDQADVDAVVTAALDAGVNYFDTAEMYGDGRSESMLGAALGSRRDEAIVATKWGHTTTRGADGRAGSRPVVRAAVEASLDRLGVDHIDHYQLHEPDPLTPIAETLTALQELLDEGRVRAIGCSNFSAAQLDEMVTVAAAEGVTPFATVQNRYSVLTRTPEHDGVADACARHGIGLVPYFPLESGLLTGKVRKGSPPPAGSRLDQWSAGAFGRMFLADAMVDATEELIGWATDHGHTVLELAMSWLAAQPAVVSVIAGASNPDQIAANAGAITWRLDADELEAIDAICDRHRA